MYVYLIGEASCRWHPSLWGLKSEKPVKLPIACVRTRLTKQHVKKSWPGHQKIKKHLHKSTPYKINSNFFNRIIDHWPWKQLYIHTSSIPPFWNLSGYKAGLLAILIYQPRPQPLESAFQHSGCTVDDSEILHQLRLVVYSHYLQGLYILGGAGVLPSTVFLMNDCNGPGTIHVPCSVNMYVYIYIYVVCSVYILWDRDWMMTWYVSHWRTIPKGMYETIAQIMSDVHIE